MNKILLCLTVAVLFASAFATSSYTYYVFACEWAGSLCATQDCTNTYDAGLNVQNMNIHGLWPSVTSGTQPTNCNGAAWNPSAINSTTTAAMVADWSGLYSDAAPFHQHEWQTHGTCWNNPNPKSTDPINDFFSQVILVAKTLDVYNALVKNGVTPNADQSYSTAQYTAAMKAAFNVDELTINCISDSSDFLGWSDKSYFNGFYMCLNLSYQPINCPSSAVDVIRTNAPNFGSSGCSYDSDLYMPPISTSSISQ